MQKGEEFPHFVLQDENGERMDSAMLKGLRYVLYFYSRDNTSGCTTEALEFTGLFPKFMLRNIPVFGVSGDSVESHLRFKEKNGLRVKLLSDPDHTLASQVGAYGPRKGKEVGNIRTTFLIGKDGRIEDMWTDVKASGHAQVVLDCALSRYKNDGVREF